MVEIQCKYYNVRYYGGRIHYKCVIDNYALDEEEWKFQGKHFNLKTNLDVIALALSGKCLTKVPRGLLKYFPNLQALEIRDSSLTSLTKCDITEYKKLRIIIFEVVSIEFLPENLFEDFMDLEQISFTSCKLIVIEPFILDGLKSLQQVSFINNPNYHIKYTINQSQLSIPLNEFKSELFRKYYTLYPHFPTSSQQMIQNTLSNDFKDFLKNENFKDFKIKIDDREFCVHKCLFAARSSVLAEMIHKNPDAENLNLVNISVETFEQVLHFIYNDKLIANKEEINFLHLFAAAGRLNIEVLKNIATAHLFDHINSENALSILSLSNRYKHEMLKQKVFGFIKQTNTFMKFEPKWASQPEMLGKLIKIHKEKDEAMKKFNEEYQKIIKNTEDL